MLLVFAFLGLSLSRWVDTNNFTGVSFRRFTGDNCHHEYDINYYIPEELCVNDESGHISHWICNSDGFADFYDDCVGGVVTHFDSYGECHTNMGRFDPMFTSYKFSRCWKNYWTTNWDDIDGWNEPDVDRSVIGGLSVYAHYTSDCSDDYAWMEYTYFANLTDWHNCHEYGENEYAKFSCEFVQVGKDHFNVNVYSDEECTVPLRHNQYQKQCIKKPGSKNVYYNYKCASVAQNVIACLGMFSGKGYEKDMYAMRMFRDNFLMRFKLGRKFVNWYYKISPRLNMFMENHAMFKYVVRSFFTPLLLAIRLAY